MSSKDTRPKRRAAAAAANKVTEAFQPLDDDFRPVPAKRPREQDTARTPLGILSVNVNPAKRHRGQRATASPAPPALEAQEPPKVAPRKSSRVVTGKPVPSAPVNVTRDIIQVKPARRRASTNLRSPATNDTGEPSTDHDLSSDEEDDDDDAPLGDDDAPFASDNKDCPPPQPTVAPAAFVVDKDGCIRSRRRNAPSPEPLPSRKLNKNSTRQSGSPLRS
ncbi:hypothetical protein C8A00DRAFT_38313 [Chaetomidium leptoderma]|uniref:Uncharacterized protein n=1 Tax=Chaetomidium leptoderma TaxID=669021 RepID=A0AAN6VDX3_9PEZI|nr:hypothetical protein C8A00DRAFT_38313 [Chaetomidium leptoderma]